MAEVAQRNSLRRHWRELRAARPPAVPPRLPAPLTARLTPALAAAFDEALAQHPDLPLAFQNEAVPLPALDAFQPRGNSVRKVK